MLCDGPLQTVKEVIFENISLEIVGAIINCPAADCNVFAESSGEYAMASAGRSMSAPTRILKRCKTKAQGAMPTSPLW